MLGLNFVKQNTLNPNLNLSGRKSPMSMPLGLSAFIGITSNFSLSGCSDCGGGGGAACPKGATYGGG